MLRNTEIEKPICS